MPQGRKDEAFDARYNWAGVPRTINSLVFASFVCYKTSISFRESLKKGLQKGITHKTNVEDAPHIKWNVV